MPFAKPHHHSRIATAGLAVSFPVVSDINAANMTCSSTLVDKDTPKIGVALAGGDEITCVICLTADQANASDSSTIDRFNIPSFYKKNPGAGPFFVHLQGKQPSTWRQMSA